MREAKVVLTQDISSGRVHERVYLDGRMLSSEACNLDEAGTFRVVDTIKGIETSDLCRRCFPRMSDLVDNDEVTE